VKKFLFASALIAIAAPAFATDIDVSINIGQPGFYGRLDIGDYPQPRLIYLQPRIIERVSIERPPIYLHVPPGHAKNWRKHCGRYDACGERVYFVQDNWYQREYVPRYQQRHADGRDGRRDEYRDDRDDYREKRGNNQQGEGHGHNKNR
jgi:hypothetical protein